MKIARQKEVEHVTSVNIFFNSKTLQTSKLIYFHNMHHIIPFWKHTTPLHLWKCFKVWASKESQTLGTSKNQHSYEEVLKGFFKEPWWSLQHWRQWTLLHFQHWQPSPWGLPPEEQTSLIEHQAPSLWGQAQAQERWCIWQHHQQGTSHACSLGKFWPMSSSQRGHSLQNQRTLQLATSQNIYLQHFGYFTCIMGTF